MSGNAHDEDRLLDDATAALRDTSVPDGPPPALKEATLSALGRRQTMRLALKIAAVFVVACCGLLIYANFRAPVRPNTKPVATPSPGPATEPATVPAVAQEQRRPEPANPRRAEVEASGPSVTGTVHFAGHAPDPQQIEMSAVRECAAQHPSGVFDDSLVVNGGRLANVVVSVRFADGQVPPAGAAPATPAVLDQKGCQYRPHVLAMRVGQPIAVANSDAFLHNIHALSVDNPGFNVGQPTRDPGRVVGVMKAPEIFRVKCDVHPWMGAYVHVIEHPFFAVTTEDGSYAIPAGLPDGTYALVAWHEKLGEKRAAVVVKGGKAEAVDFTFALENQP
jgi:plastocyanin